MMEPPAAMSPALSNTVSAERKAWTETLYVRGRGPVRFAGAVPMFLIVAYVMEVGDQDVTESADNQIGQAPLHPDGSDLPRHDAVGVVLHGLDVERGGFRRLHGLAVQHAGMRHIDLVLSSSWAGTRSVLGTSLRPR